MNYDDNTWGLVFSGGGGKGAYEIGVWKAILEENIIHIGAVSGTSVGALNAALFAGADYYIADKIWANISPETILPINEKAVVKKILKGLSLPIPEIITPVYMINIIPEILKISQIALTTINIVNGLSDEGIFKKDGLARIIEESGVVRGIKKSKIQCYATCYCISEKKAEYFCLNNESEITIKKMLLASSSLPWVYSYETIDERIYCDGGVPEVGDNTPVKPLYDAGFKRLIVVYLDDDKEEAKRINDNYPDASIIHIFPSNSLGSLINGTLNFKAEYARSILQQGHDDAKKIFVKGITDNNYIFTVETNVDLIKAIKKGAIKFVVKGKLAGHIDKAKIILGLSATALAVLVAGIISAPITGGMSMLAAAPIAASVGISVDVVLAVIALGGVTSVLEIYRNYNVDVLSRDENGNVVELALTKKEREKNRKK